MTGSRWPPPMDCSPLERARWTALTIEVASCGEFMTKQSFVRDLGRLLRFARRIQRRASHRYQVSSTMTGSRWPSPTDYSPLERARWTALTIEVASFFASFSFTDRKRYNGERVKTPKISEQIVSSSQFSKLGQEMWDMRLGILVSRWSVKAPKTLADLQKYQLLSPTLIPRADSVKFTAVSIMDFLYYIYTMLATDWKTSRKHWLNRIRLLSQEIASGRTRFLPPLVAIIF